MSESGWRREATIRENEMRTPRLHSVRSIDFVDELPRLPTGKLAKRTVREPYWAGHASWLM